MSRKLIYSLLAVLLAAGFLVVACQREYSAYQPRAVMPVTSKELAETTIVPTLDTPLAKSGNVVWCATFQAAWNEARDDLIGGPLRISNAHSVADRLNGSPVTKKALPPGSYLAAAGRIEDGIVEKIQQDMSQQFPGVQMPDFTGAVGFVTYGYLDTRVSFTTPFVDMKQPIQFSDAAGGIYSVSGFGLHQGSDWDLLEKQAAQVSVLFSQTDDESEDLPEAKLTAFALDLTADQGEQQVIVAVLPRAKHLRAALNDLERRIKELSSNGYSAKLSAADSLKIPNIAFHVDHEFAELQGVDKVIENAGEFQGLYIRRAAQSIRFRLDKSGATIISESNMYAEAIPRDFVVDRPFLIVMKLRSAKEPYFVAWIDNAELLELSGT